MSTYKDKILNKYHIKCITLNEFLEYLDKLDKCTYKQDTQKIIDVIIKNTDDEAQISTLKRIIDSKPQNIKHNDKNTCPHCNKKNFIINPEDDYVICGYTHKGYDWNGCGKDWCNVCCKKLCKQWGTDALYNKFNRVHTAKCCKKHAEKLGVNYEDYCQCSNKPYKIDRLHY
jgi:hypothetical protein